MSNEKNSGFSFRSIFITTVFGCFVFAGLFGLYLRWKSDNAQVFVKVENNSLRFDPVRGESKEIEVFCLQDDTLLARTKYASHNSLVITCLPGTPSMLSIVHSVGTYNIPISSNTFIEKCFVTSDVIRNDQAIFVFLSPRLR